MKKFKFSLSSVLTYKGQVLESLQGEYSALMAQVRRQEEVLEAVRGRYHSYKEEFNTRQREGLLITEARMYQSGLRALEKEIEREAKRLEEDRSRAEQKRGEVVEAKKETSSIEKLKEKKLKQYEKAVQKSEEAFIDEFVSAARAASRSAEH